MAKKDKEEVTSTKDEADSLKLSKLLVKQFNDGDDKIAWNLGTDHDNPTEVKEFISFGSTILNYICTNRRNGGAPVGKITEIVGEEASGKSLLAAHLIAECQKRGGIAVYIDTENAASPEFLAQLGVNINELVYLQPGCCEAVGEAIEKTIMTARAKAPNKLVLIVWDSIANCPTRIELEGSYDLNMNLQLEKSKVLSKMMRKLVDTLGKERICVVFTNQLKTKIGVMYGDPMTTPGGKAVPYAASLRIRLTRSSQLVQGKPKKGEETEGGDDGGDKKEAKGAVYGINTIAKVIKCRLGPPLRQCRFDITFSSGIDDEESWLPLLHERGEIEKNKGWCYYSKYPSGKMSLKEDPANPKKEIEYDRGLMFREKEWKKTLREFPEFRTYVLNDLEKHLIVKYGETPADFAGDADSLLDVESAVEAATGN
jgi:recombination protein RecA